MMTNPMSLNTNIVVEMLKPVLLLSAHLKLEIKRYDYLVCQCGLVEPTSTPP
jgi:hypothetical protein